METTEVVYYRTGERYKLNIQNWDDPKYLHFVLSALLNQKDTNATLEGGNL